MKKISLSVPFLHFMYLESKLNSQAIIIIWSQLKIMEVMKNAIYNLIIKYNIFYYNIN